MPPSQLPPVLPYHPITFLERGVAVPFTTPALSGTRARPGQRNEVELILPNLSGSRGVYVLAWRSICDLFAPTMHDRMLNDHILKLQRVTPASIREQAHLVAAQGLAGDEAAAASQVAKEADHRVRVLINFLLLEILVEQAETRFGAPPAVDGRPAFNMERRAQRAVAIIAPTIGHPPNEISLMLEEIAGALTHIGIDRQAETARIPRMLVALNRMCEEMTRWGIQQREQVRELGEMICDVAQLTLTLAKVTLRDVMALTADIMSLLQDWIENPRKFIELAARPEWLLDGWEQICLLWETAIDWPSKITALVEITHLLPVLPREAADWVGSDIISRSEQRRLALRRIVPVNEDWRTGAKVFNLIARNERLRALEMKIGLQAA